MRRRKPTNWAKVITLGGLALLVIALALPFVVQLKPWLPELEEQLSQAIGEPVAFNGARAGLSPRPFLELSGVSLGPDKDVQATSARLYPDLRSLFEPTKHIVEIEVSGAVVRRSAVLRFMGVRARAGGLQRIRLGRIRAPRAGLDVLEGKFGEVDMDAMLNRENQLVSLVLEAADGKSKLEVAPAAEGLQLTFSAQRWQAPIGPAIPLERFFAQGTLSEGKLALSELTAGGFGGDARGGLELTWNRGWNLSGRVHASRVDLQPALRALKSPLPVRGSLEGDLRFSATAETPDALASALKLEGTFTVSNGVLNDFDFPRVIRGAPRDGVRGGQTQFEQLAGSVQIGNGYRFTGLKLSSGLMSASGNISIAERGELSGTMSVELKGTASTLGSTVITSGTLRDPVLLPPGR